MQIDILKNFDNSKCLTLRQDTGGPLANQMTTKFTFLISMSPKICKDKFLIAVIVMMQQSGNRVEANRTKLEHKSKTPQESNKSAFGFEKMVFNELDTKKSQF